jgi:hypothetical protein
MVNKKGIKIIIVESITKILDKLWYSNEDLCIFLTDNWDNNSFILSSKIVKLYKPLDNTTAYKWYFSKLDRTIIFHYSKNEKWVVYPIFFWNKKTKLWKNTIKILVEKDIELYQKQFNDDLEKWRYKIYHK